MEALRWLLSRLSFVVALTNLGIYAAYLAESQGWYDSLFFPLLPFVFGCAYVLTFGSPGQDRTGHDSLGPDRTYLNMTPLATTRFLGEP